MQHTSPPSSVPAEAIAASPSIPSILDTSKSPLVPDFSAVETSTELHQRLRQFLLPLLHQLDERIDARLVRTFLATIAALLQYRHRNHGLLLSELGGYLLPPEHAPAGTKRLSNLLRCSKWSATAIHKFLWRGAEARRAELNEAGEDALLLWDESVLEKPESLQSEALCAVRSSKAKRLSRIKPGYFNPPGGRPVFVPGWQWLCLLMMGRSGPPTVAAMRWWSTRGLWATNARTLQAKMLRRCARAWGKMVCHIFDRGYAGAPWLGLLLEYRLRFILRWPKSYLLKDKAGRELKAWQLTRGQRSWGQRLIWDARRRCERKTGIYALEVLHPAYDEPLWLVVSRPGKGHEPWYLLTNEPITSIEDAWTVVFAYARRWQIEMTFRFNKSELALESPRLWEWERRVKLLLMVTLAYAFLLTLLAWRECCDALLRHYCHRTGKRSRDTSAPLYRLRTAISRLWMQCHPHPALFAKELLQNSG